jgi:hypothetical protein
MVQSQNDKIVTNIRGLVILRSAGAARCAEYSINRPALQAWRPKTKRRTLHGADAIEAHYLVGERGNPLVDILGAQRVAAVVRGDNPVGQWSDILLYGGLTAAIWLANYEKLVCIGATPYAGDSAEGDFPQELPFGRTLRGRGLRPDALRLDVEDDYARQDLRPPNPIVVATR